MRRLLIVACSQAKRPTPGLLPALERYDGPVFRVLRKYLQPFEAAPLTILIVSARFGLIRASKKIRDYDVRITSARATALRRQVTRMFRRVWQEEEWRAIGVCVGKGYAEALTGMGPIINDPTKIDMIGGGLGQRLTRLRTWLHDVAPSEEAPC